MFAPIAACESREQAVLQIQRNVRMTMWSELECADIMLIYYARACIVASCSSALVARRLYCDRSTSSCADASLISRS